MKGPEEESTVTITSSEAELAPLSALSLTVTLNSIVLLTEGTTSQIFADKPCITVSISGINRVLSVVGGKDLNIGPNVFVGSGGITSPISSSICSQQYVSSSLSLSIPIASSWKGVDAGIVKSAGAIASGAVFPVGVCTSQSCVFT